MRRPPRLLLIAFALSLLLHALIATFLRPARPSPQTQAEVISVVRSVTIAAARQTPPPPRPHQTPHPRIASPVRTSLPKGTVAAGSGGSSTSAPATPAPTPAPAATVAAVSACSRKNLGPSVLATPGPPDIPTETRAEATNGTVVVKVQLDAGAAITGTSVEQSSGNSSLDLVAVAMARDARYSPAMADCKPVAGEYAFSVKFVAW